ncbi:MAG: NAD(P)-dependent oxidoreductase [Treponema sp.]|nr:NAD(P)-dependent oxidoreductase [Treponema sp.]
MNKQRVFITGVTGAMGFPALKNLLLDLSEIDLVALVCPSKENEKIIKPFLKIAGFTVVWGDLLNYDDIKKCVDNADMVLHIGGLVSPKADNNPELTMDINVGSAVKIVKAIKELNQTEKTRLVYICSIAATGDRMPPIHWGRVGDPIKPSFFDYYAMSKIEAERYIVESGLPYWVSLRQTGIIGPSMADIEDAIMFHQCLDNVLEYASDRDSAVMLRNLCRKERKNELGGNFWGHIFNIGGGESCRVSAYNLYKKLFGMIGINNLSYVMESKWSALRNFHGQYYLDSDKLNDILQFRSDSMEYFYKAYLKKLGIITVIAKIITKLPGGQKLIGGIIKKRFHKLTLTENGTERFVKDNMEHHIAAFWGSWEAYQTIVPMEKFVPFSDWDTVVHIDHGYDERKPEAELNLQDIKNAAKFRGGECLSESMTTGSWTDKLKFRCAFNHEFDASPRLVLEGGHWCPVCERESWNYYERAKVDRFFAQVWYPLHDKNEKEWKYNKMDFKTYE